MTASQWSEIEVAFAAIHALGIEERAPHLSAIEDEVVRKEVISLLDHAGVIKARNALGPRFKPRYNP